MHFSVFYCGNLCCTLFMLHFFHTALFPCYTFCLVIFSWCTSFRLSLFLINFFISCCTFTRCNIWQYFGNNGNILFCLLLPLHSSHVAIFSCCTLFMLYYFQRCSQEPPRISEIEGLALTIN